MWVEVEIQAAADTLRTYRGSVDEKDVETFLSDSPQKFITLTDVYWFIEPDDEDEDSRFEILGSGKFKNFTGEMLFRTDTIINLAVLKAGISNEPKELLKQGKLLEMANKNDI